MHESVVGRSNILKYGRWSMICNFKEVKCQNPENAETYDKSSLVIIIVKVAQ